MVRRPVRVNEAEYGTPRSSAFGAAFRRLLIGVPTPATRGSRGKEPVRRAGLIRMQPPVLTDRAPFYNLVGAFAARNARTQTVFNTHTYKGILPLAQQPKIKRVNPWTDPTRGLP